MKKITPHLTIQDGHLCHPCKASASNLHDVVGVGFSFVPSSPLLPAPLTRHPLCQVLKGLIGTHASKSKWGTLKLAANQEDSIHSPGNKYI
jgi:hypothetical protein